MRDLFAGVPARRKFLRADSTETAHVAEALTLLGLLISEVFSLYEAIRSGHDRGRPVAVTRGSPRRGLGATTRRPNRRSRRAARAAADLVPEDPPCRSRAGVSWVRQLSVDVLSNAHLFRAHVTVRAGGGGLGELSTDPHPVPKFFG